MVPLQQSGALLPERYPRFTLVGQAMGSVRVGLEALGQLVPEVGGWAVWRLAVGRLVMEWLVQEWQALGPGGGRCRPTRLGCRGSVGCGGGRGGMRDLGHLNLTLALPFAHHIPRNQVFIDTTGWAFTYPFARLAGARVASYTHYPTVSSDMIRKVCAGGCRGRQG